MTNQYGGGLVMPYEGIAPKIGADVYLAPGSAVIGDVEIGAKSSIWFNTVVRGDVHYIRIGENTNIQDGSMVHVSASIAPTTIGSNVLIGHQCIIHGCTIHDWAFIGMGSVILDDAVVESDAMLAAGSMLTPGKRVPTGQLWGGRPARYMRDLTPEQLAYNRSGPKHYMDVAAKYLAQAKA